MQTVLGPEHRWRGVRRYRRFPVSSLPQRVVGWRSPLFISDILEHLLVEHQIGDKAFEAFNFGLEFTDSACFIDASRVM
jgi:hypothetical protein